MKRTLSIILAVILLFSVLPLSVSAADVENADTGTELTVNVKVNADYTVTATWNEIPGAARYGIWFLNFDPDYHYGEGVFTQVEIAGNISSLEGTSYTFDTWYTSRYSAGHPDYKIKVRAYDSFDHELAVGESSVFQTNIPIQPSPQVTLTSKGIVSWTHVDNVKTVDIYLYRITENIEEYTKITGGTYQMDDSPVDDFAPFMEEGRQYSVRIEARGVNSGYRGFAPVKSAVVTAEDTKDDIRGFYWSNYTLNWDAYPNATLYGLWLYKKNGNAYEQKGSILTTTSTSYDFASLFEQYGVGTYRVKVQARSNETTIISHDTDSTYCDYQETISSVSATVTAPKVGQTPSYHVFLPLYGGYTLANQNGGGFQNGVLWYNVSDNVAMTPSDTFQSGKKYQVRLYLNASSGYSFADDLTATINNNEASVIPNIMVALVDYTFTMGTFTKSIDKVEVTNVTEPTAGAKPAYTATVPSDSGYMLAGIDSGSWSNSVIWYDGNGAELSPNTTFVQGKQYKVKVALSTSSDGYEFRSMQIGGKVTGTINDKGASVSVENDGDNCFVSYTFTCAEATGYTLSGTATSYLDDSVGATLMLFRKNTDMDVFVGFTVAASDDGSYQFSNVAAGDYRLTVLKNNHVPRDYAVTVSGNITQGVKIHPVGDINGDGKITNYDYSRVNQHTCGTKKLTDYPFACADVNGDNKVTNFDAGKINQHASGTKFLW